MSWISIKNQQDVDVLNEIFDNFHDSCLKEMCFSTGGFVTKELAMNVIGSPIARFLFQRQANEKSVIELEFKDVLQINIKPVESNQGVDIISTHLYFKDGIFFWSEKDYEFHERQENITWIAAKSVQWRERGDALGEKMVYMID